MRMKFDIQRFTSTRFGTPGNDTIVNGDDSINNFGDNVTISVGSGNDSVENNLGSNNVTISGDDGNDSIQNLSGNVSINGGAGDDEIDNSGENVTIDGGNGADTIDNLSGDSVMIDGGEGDDSIHNYGYNVTITGGAGNDEIFSNRDSVSISGGEGNDYIYNSNSNGNVSISGGIGDDHIAFDVFSSPTVIQYSNGDGNDTISGFYDTISGAKSDSTLQIFGEYSTTTSGDDMIVNVGEGSILLRNAANISPNIITATDSSNSGGTLFLESDQKGDIWLGGYDYFNNAAVWGNSTISNIDSSNNGYAHILAGNDLSNQIIAGSGSTSMWGGTGGDDTMIGGSSRDYFLYANGNGNDLAKNFKAGSSPDSDIAALQGNLGVIEREGNVVTVNGADGGTLIIETDFSTDEAILYTIDGTNIGAAKLADSTNTLYYDKNVYHFRFNDNAGRLFYWGNEDVTIALDNSTAQDYVGLKTIITKSDTEKASGNLNIIGNELDNEIYSGAGNDYLTGGSGADTFYWGSGDGYDIITDAESSDVINLYNVSISDISSVDISDNKLDLRLNDGSHLDAYYGTQATFQFSDGSRYKYENNNWQHLTGT